MYHKLHPSMLGPSFPNHLFPVAASANTFISKVAASTTGSWVCDSSPTATVQQAYKLGKPGSGIYAYAKAISPCMDFPALPDLLNTAGLTWNYYSAPQNDVGSEWNALDAIGHIRNSAQWGTNAPTASQFFPGAANGTFAKFSSPVEPNALS